jgi:pimeloyl-[acyl-carrier protein] methyl ester esterase
MPTNLVLFHGWGFTPDVMEPLSKKLSETYQVSIVDLNKPIDVIRNAIPDHAILMGWSLGGLFALKLASIIPTKKVVLVASNPCFLAKDSWPGIDPEFFNQFVNELKVDPDAALQKFGYLQVKGMEDERDAFKLIKNYLSKELSRPMLLDILKIDMRGGLKKTNCPVQFILGGKDPLVPIKVHEHIKALMPEVEISIIEDAGHVPVLFNIDAVVQYVI